MTTHSPEDFAQPNAPARPIGIENEYHFEPSEPTASKLEELIENIGLTELHGYCSNGARIYNYSGIEYATPECLGPRQAAVADHAGIIVMDKLATRHKFDSLEFGDGGKVWMTLRNSGSFDCSKGKTESRGHHRNYLTSFPDTPEKLELFKDVMGSFLASSIVWDGVGLVTNYGYLLGQKAPGIGQGIITDGDNQTSHGKKPIANLFGEGWNAGANDKIHGDWALLEVRKDDAHMLLSSSVLGYAATSMALRLVEQGYINQSNYKEYALVDPVEALHAVNTSFGQRIVDLKSGKHTTALSLQMKFAELMNKMMGDQAPAQPDEAEALAKLGRIHSKLAGLNMKELDLAPLVPDVEWAAKRYYLTKEFGEDFLVNGSLRKAVGFELLWHCIDDRSIGLKVGDRLDPMRQQLDGDIQTAVHTPPPSRAAARGHAIKKELCQNETQNWNKITLKGGRSINLDDPWNPELPNEAAA